MLARRLEINTQLQQIFDSFLLALSSYAAHLLRDRSTAWLDLDFKVLVRTLPAVMFGLGAK